MGRKLSILIVDEDMGKHTSLEELRNYSVVLQGAGDKYEVVKNRYGDPGGHVKRQDLEDFLDKCGVRSAT